MIKVIKKPLETQVRFRGEKLHLLAIQKELSLKMGIFQENPSRSKFYEWTLSFLTI